MSRIRVLIVDDEPPARAKVRRFLARDAEVEVVGEVGSGTEAVEAIRRLTPDVVFLDVQMPGLDGFGVLEALQRNAPIEGPLVGGTAPVARPPGRRAPSDPAADRDRTADADTFGDTPDADTDEPPPIPHIVFVTAYDEHAVNAFEVHAVDYLLKPFAPDRFARALERVKERVRSRRDDGLDRRLREVLAQARPSTAYLERLLVPDGARSVLLDVARIDWIEAEHNYVRLHVGQGSHLVRGTLAALEERLDPTRFIRIHRSRIVNAERIREIHPWSHGDQLVVLHDGTELMMSRRYRGRLARLTL